MSNPVFNRLEKEWKGGVQTAPGQPAPSPQTHPYAGNAGTAGQWQQNPGQPGYGQPNTYNPAAAPAYDAQAFAQAQQAYAAPSADAVDTGRMTHEDVVVKTALCLALLIGGGALSWWATSINPGVGMAMMFGGLLVGFVLAMVNIFSKTIRPALIMAYSVAEGIALGALSSVTEAAIPGVFAQAVIATAVVFGVTLLLFSFGVIRNSPKLMKFTLIALLGIIFSRILIWIFSSFGWIGAAGGPNEPTILGFPLAVVISLAAVVIGTLCLIADFDQAKVGVEQGAPAKYSWACAFGIMVTVVWLYIEILNILARINSD